jgi:nucleoside 2-deoxyribosyltransferase
LDGPGSHDVFVDYEDLLKAQDTDERINILIEQADAVLYLITVSSVRSFWCGKEVGYAQCLGKPIVPIAGPCITDEFIKSQSVPWISGLKWVNWWEKNRGRKIVEAMVSERGVVELMRIDELQQTGLGGDSEDCRAPWA